jgi:hypothetical protein
MPEPPETGGNTAVFEPGKALQTSSEALQQASPPDGGPSTDNTVGGLGVCPLPSIDLVDGYDGFLDFMFDQNTLDVSSCHLIDFTLSNSLLIDRTNGV